MARDTDDLQPITGRDDLVAWIAEGSKPKDAFRIGTEHEKFVFDIKTHAPKPYDGPGGIAAILTGMQARLGWEPILDEGRIIGLAGPSGGGAISIEPGGQFELSGGALETLHETCEEVHGHLKRVHEVAAPLGVGFLGVGFAPEWPLEAVPHMPKSRYRIMRAYMPKVGTRGLDMMHRTATIQVNLDFADEADMVAKMRVGMALQPLATALFAASPFRDGRATGLRSERAAVWLDTDGDRAGILPFVFDEGFGFEAYVDWALKVPMYFIKRGATYHDVAGSSFTDLLDGRHPALPGEKAVLSDWTNHLSTLFPDVRLKRFLEMRGADGGPWSRICALPAFWVGLLYDDGALADTLDLIADWPVEEIIRLRETVPSEGLSARFMGRPLVEIAREVLAIARRGLDARARLSASGASEAVYLDPLIEMAETGRTLADDMIARFEDEWGGDIGRVYTALAY
ncbi:MAG: glutamate--cysteine ligase [Hyphomicrobiaceae bacterium]|nr:glutamate--cysteine ligase [Hyphomicrobiaceae bacterium]